MNNPNARSHKEPIDSIIIYKKRTDISNLDPEERDYLESYERGEWISDLTPERVKELQAYARVTLEEREKERESKKEIIDP
ncbi:hypothetical protein EZJ55_19330 [Microcystis aeruginosa EAWAG127a]|jgi:hypothetical protein|uniref:Uncharacterized protein n=1 Tax=Microcystis aeruginosa EAWAG127a TaxID=2529855 RepID=A0A5J5LY54_MICAE|nr:MULTISPECIES: hypothetical protein [Microcystis]KAB0242381.1 hypothetical protein EZJ55_19330 [Microcystis aeruginosa EAWAG127a]MCA2701137.1 hypothetical protein [Microcystis sp. M179S2]